MKQTLVFGYFTFDSLKPTEKTCQGVTFNNKFIMFIFMIKCDLLLQ